MKHPELKLKLLEPGIMALDNDEAIISNLNAKNITVKKAISVHDIQEYLMLTDDLDLIESSESVECKRAVRALEIFNQFDIAHKTKGALIENKLTSILSDLVANTMLSFTEDDKTAILSLGVNTVSWAEQNGYNPLRIGYLAKARVE